MDSSSADQAPIPLALAPPCQILRGATSALIWTGNSDLRYADDHYSGIASLKVELLPHPSVAFDFEHEITHKMPLEKLFFPQKPKESDCLVCHNLLGISDVIVMSYGKTISGIANGFLCEETILFDKAKYVIINGPEYQGELVLINGEFTRSRIKAENKTSGDVTIDCIFHEAPDKHAVYQFTHTLYISFPNEVPFKEFKSIETAVFYTLSLMNQRWVGIVGPWLESNSVIKAISPSITKTTRNRGTHNWYDPMLGDVFPCLFNDVFSVLNDVSKKNAFTGAIHALLEGFEVSIESSIVLYQTAFEALAWCEIVDVRKICSVEGFEKLPAADKIRWLASIFNIELFIPTHFVELCVLRSEYNLQDLAGVLVYYRNAITHGSSKNSKRIYDRENASEELQSARHLAIVLLQQLILAMCNYQGNMVRNDLDTQFLFRAIRPVPWGIKSSNSSD